MIKDKIYFPADTISLLTELVNAIANKYGEKHD